MALSGGVRVEGLNALIRQLEQAGGDVEDMREVFTKIAARGAKLASGFAPRDTGRLADSGRGSKSKNKAVIAAGGARVRYAAVQNYGWPARGIPAARFMQRADERLEPFALKELDKGLREAIRRRGLD